MTDNWPNRRRQRVPLTRSDERQTANADMISCHRQPVPRQWRAGSQ